MRVRPDGIADAWEDCSLVAQADMIAYSQLRDHEEMKDREMMLRVMGRLE